MTGSRHEVGAVSMRKLYERVCAAEATVAAAFLILMVILIFLGGVMRMLATPDQLVERRRHGPVRLGLLPVRRHRLAQQQPDVDRGADQPAAGQPAGRPAGMLNYGIIVAFLVYLIVMGLYLSWISRIRSFQGIPEISYSWVTMSLPVGAMLLLITTAAEGARRAARRARRRRPRSGRRRC